MALRETKGVLMEDEAGAVWQAMPPPSGMRYDPLGVQDWPVLDTDQPSAWEREQARRMLAEPVDWADSWLVRLLSTFRRWRPW